MFLGRSRREKTPKKYNNESSQKAATESKTGRRDGGAEEKK